MTESEFDALVDESLAYMHRAIEQCNREWDFQSYQRWDIDLDRECSFSRTAPGRRSTAISRWLERI
jgi:hypothetical protein